VNNDKPHQMEMLSEWRLISWASAT